MPDVQEEVSSPRRFPVCSLHRRIDRWCRSSSCDARARGISKPTMATGRAHRVGHEQHLQHGCAELHRSADAPQFRRQCGAAHCGNRDARVCADDIHKRIPPRVAAQSPNPRHGGGRLLSLRAVRSGMPARSRDGRYSEPTAATAAGLSVRSPSLRCIAAMSSPARRSARRRLRAQARAVRSPGPPEREVGPPPRRVKRRSAPRNAREQRARTA
jgi:hypothetical protein